MNPFTKSLSDNLPDHTLRTFIVYWDTLEQLAIRIFRAKVATDADAFEHQTAQLWLSENYIHPQPQLDRLWRQAKVAGKLASEDPFLMLLGYTHAQDFVGNWAALQALPAAREALNNLLIQLNLGDLPL